MVRVPRRAPTRDPRRHGNRMPKSVLGIANDLLNIIDALMVGMRTIAM